jgi:hypothetical protein
VNLRHANAVGVLAVAIGGFLLSSTSSDHRHSGVRPLNGGSFTTAYPASWHLSAKHGPTGIATYQLSSTGAPINGLGIPPAGTIGITIAELPVSALRELHLAGRRSDRAAAKQSALELLPDVVGTPSEARGVTRTTSPHATSLNGADAAQEAYTYRLGAREIVQVDILSHREGLIFLIELDAEPALAPRGQAALQAIKMHWRWH